MFSSKMLFFSLCGLDVKFVPIGFTLKGIMHSDSAVSLRIC